MPSEILPSTLGLTHVTNVKVSGGLPSKASPAKGSGTPKQKGKTKKNRRNNDVVQSLFAFDIHKEQYNWGRPKRRIKQISRFDPTIKEKQSDCKIGHGFLCPQCSAVNTYDSHQCWQCHLECCYEAGVGVVVVQDRRISYRPPSPEKKKAKTRKKLISTTQGKGRSGRLQKEKSSLNKNNSTSSRSRNNGEENLTGNRRKPPRKRTMFANLKKSLKDATKSNPESPQDENDAAIVDRVKEATLKWTESTIAASKDGAYSTESSNLPTISEDCSEATAKSAKKPRSLEDDIECCQELKQQLTALQLKYDEIFPNTISIEEEFRDTISKLEAAILQRNKDAAAFGKSIASAGSRIEEIKRRVESLATQRNEFVKQVESRGWTSVPKNVPNYSTRIDSISIKTSQMRTECDAAKERVKDLMSGNEVAKQEKAKTTKDLEEMETKHGETFAQCYKEIESFKQQLSEATLKIATMATEKAKLVEKVTSTLIYVSKVRSAAETQAAKISTLESSVESLTAQRDAAVEQCKEDVARLSGEKEEAVSKFRSLEDTVKDMRGQIENLKSQVNANVLHC